MRCGPERFNTLLRAFVHVSDEGHREKDGQNTTCRKPQHQFKKKHSHTQTSDLEAKNTTAVKRRRGDADENQIESQIATLTDPTGPSSHKTE
ncbi:hypothetical protein EYF80_040879 [Liparis tanakae]|uniref:Uncharacterized protein n=1 Tax=Liparis tanakae TaxID=230148 RepID=A0A4Z2G5T9_9TELE|nr:hypothetical protein EYF80_040879 [Liparis tanakae]